MPKAKVKKENKLTCCGITQDFELEHWGIGLTDAEKLQILPDLQNRLAAAKAGDIRPLAEWIKWRIEQKGCVIAEFYAICHNKDVRKVWSEVEKKEIVECKTNHIHVRLKFAQGGGALLADIAAAATLEPQYIEKAEKGRFAWDNMVSYIIHIKYMDKHQYDKREVLTLAGKPYEQLANERWADWLKGRGAVEKKKAVQGIDDLERKILEGEVTRTQVHLTDEYYGIYARNKRRCDDAFAVYGERRAYKTLQALENGEYKLTVYFITGGPGAGKTVLAKHLIETLIDESARLGERWRVCATAASNPMDEYAGEEIIWMDDVRGGTMTAADWLKLLDPYNASPASARYHNKRPAARCIVITSSKGPLEFFYFCKQMGGGDRSEAMGQFLRRIQSLVQVVQLDDDRIYRIADSKRLDKPQMVGIPGAADSCGSVPSVQLTYSFGKVTNCSEDKAVEILTEKVLENNGYDLKAARMAELVAPYLDQLPVTPTDAEAGAAVQSGQG